MSMIFTLKRSEALAKVGELAEETGRAVAPPRRFSLRQRRSCFPQSHVFIDFLSSPDIQLH